MHGSPCKAPPPPANTRTQGLLAWLEAHTSRNPEHLLLLAQEAAQDGAPECWLSGSGGRLREQSAGIRVQGAAAAEGRCHHQPRVGPRKVRRSAARTEHPVCLPACLPACLSVCLSVCLSGRPASPRSCTAVPPTLNRLSVPACLSVWLTRAATKVAPTAGADCNCRIRHSKGDLDEEKSSAVCGG
jgi:hypothetical protein